MDVTWEYKDAENDKDDKVMEKDKKYSEWVQKYGEWAQKYNEGAQEYSKGVQQMSSKVYKRMRSVAVQTDCTVTVGTQTEEADFLTMAETLSDSLVVECSDDDADEDEEHDCLF